MTVTTYDHTSPRAARDKASGRVTGAVDCRRAKCVALTFDGGPSLTTPRLLDILKQDRSSSAATPSSPCRSYSPLPNPQPGMVYRP
ncbi:polysaccharide deacetylase family protein [Streptomyces sp. LN590]|uniref:polysaccharide deacetylase family protein n=1 Tax=unclassified Streptomyces TaxID=2593676 RepID=UPI003711BF21